MKFQMLLSIFLFHSTFQEVYTKSTISVQQLGSYPLPKSSRKVSDNYESTMNDFDDFEVRGPIRRGPQDFIDRNSRVGFIRKVYSIVTLQALVTTFITAFFLTNPNALYFLKSNVGLITTASFFGCLGISSSLIAIPKLRFSFPWNINLLGLYTILQSMVIATISSRFDPRLVFIGAMHTLIVFLSMTLFAFQPRPEWDLTTHGNIIMTALVSVITALILNIFLKVPWINTITSCFSAALFAGIIAYDTQLIVGGRHKKRSYSSKEYILASLGLYQDIMSLFIEILRILDQFTNGRRER